MVNVNYKNPYGYYTLTQGEKKFKVNLCRANCLWAEMYFFRDEKTGKNMAQLQSFFLDVKHLKKCVKKGLLEGINNFVFNGKEIAKETEIWQAIKVLTANGKKVTIK